MYKVYKIVVNDEIVYIGRTGRDLVVREKEHNRAIKNGIDRTIYNFIRESGLERIELVEVASYKNKVESKRFECYLILDAYFSGRKLYQSIPNISDR